MFPRTASSEWHGRAVARPWLVLHGPAELDRATLPGNHVASDVRAIPADNYRHHDFAKLREPAWGVRRSRGAEPYLQPQTTKAWTFLSLRMTPGSQEWLPGVVPSRAAGFEPARIHITFRLSEPRALSPRGFAGLWQPRMVRPGRTLLDLPARDAMTGAHLAQLRGV